MKNRISRDDANYWFFLQIQHTFFFIWYLKDESTLSGSHVVVNEREKCFLYHALFNQKYYTASVPFI